jgi:hypothetical protein
MNTNPKINFNIPSKFSHWKFVKLMAWICHSLCSNFLLKHVIKGKTVGAGTRERRHSN